MPVNPLIDELVARLESALTQPPIRTGIRLRSERDLADLFDMSRGRIREAIDQLVARGVLVRRHGSGTFVRKIPACGEVGDQDIPTPEQLMADLPRATIPPRLQPTSNQKQLTLALWSDWTDGQSPAAQIKLHSVIDRVQGLGHVLSVNSVVDRQGRPLSADELAPQIAAQRCDGCLVVARWAPLYLEACGQHHWPSVFMGFSEVDLAGHSCVRIDHHYPVYDAVYRLVQQGFRRIALLGYEGHDYSMVSYLRAYRHAAGDMGLDYRREVLSPEGFPRIVSACERLLADDPDAVIVLDDTLLDAFEHCWRPMYDAGRAPAIIYIGHRDSTPPAGIDWSRYETDLDYYAQQSIDTLLRLIQVAEAYRSAVSLAILPIWKPGRTHRLGSPTA